MDSQSQQSLARLVRDERIAALGTLFHGAPLVSLVLFSAAADLSAIHIHVSRLAQHTQGLLESGRVGLMIAEPDRDSRNPLTLARLSIQGDAKPLPAGDPEYDAARASYLSKFPTAALNFQLGDFLLVRIQPHSARLVTGFGRIFDLKPDDLKSILTATNP
ncbi:MAG: pyridoxamine 5'-phosphate oxidase family protein [Planctomycetaceae bacterium]|nr:pyridoxamine 5'-phosphate oxidase family protein [Planctomycetaceae bacterium]